MFMCQFAQRLEQRWDVQVSFGSGFRGNHETRVRSVLKDLPLFYLPRKKLNFTVFHFIMFILLRKEMKACIPTMLYCATINMTEIFLMW